MGWTLLVDMATTRSSHDGLPVSQIVDGFMDLLVEWYNISDIVPIWLILTDCFFQTVFVWLLTSTIKWIKCVCWWWWWWWWWDNCITGEWWVVGFMCDLFRQFGGINPIWKLEVCFVHVFFLQGISGQPDSYLAAFSWNCSPGLLPDEHGLVLVSTGVFAFFEWFQHVFMVVSEIHLDHATVLASSCNML